MSDEHIISRKTDYKKQSQRILDRRFRNKHHEHTKNQYANATREKNRTFQTLKHSHNEESERKERENRSFCAYTFFMRVCVLEKKRNTSVFA